MALEGFNIGGTAQPTGPAPATASPKTGGALSGFKIGATSTPTPTPTAAATPVATPEAQAADLVSKTTPVKTDSLFSKTKDAIGSAVKNNPVLNFFSPKPTPPAMVFNVPSEKEVSKSGKEIDDLASQLEKESKSVDTSDKAAVDAYNTKVDALQTKISAHNEKAKQSSAAAGFLDKHAQDGEDYQTIKLPFVKGGVQEGSPLGQFLFHDNAILGETLKAIIELPERATRTLGELADLSKPIDASNGSLYGGQRATKPTIYQVPSYAEAAGKNAKDLVEQGMPVTAAVIFSSAIQGGQFAQDALMYQGILESGAKAVASAAERDAAQTIAYDFLGHPQTIADAEKNYKKIQLQYNADNPANFGGNPQIVKDANNAMKTLRDNGLPSASKFKQGADKILNRPIKDLFKAGSAPSGISPKDTIRGFLQSSNEAKKVVDTLHDEIEKSIEINGRDLTQQAVQENLGLDAKAADAFIQKVEARITMANPEKASQELLQILAPETKVQIPEKTPLKDFNVGAKTKYDTPEVIKAREEAGSIQQTQSIETPERSLLRTQVADKVYGTGAAVKGKRLDIVTGGPGMRKSTMIAEPLAKQYGSLVVDSDSVKKELPEFKGGIGANAVHEESTLIARSIRQKALSNGDNVVLTTVGNSAANMDKLITEAKAHGYDVHLHNVQLPVEKSIPGIVDRFKAGTQGFVDPEYAEKVGLQPTHVHDTIKGDERISTHTKYSTDVEKGGKPTILEHSSRVQGPSNGSKALEQSGDSNISGDLRRTGNDGRPSIVGGGEKVASKLASGIEARAIEKKLTDDKFASLSTHEQAVMKDQREMATELVKNDFEKAKRIALGLENAPEGILPSIIYMKVAEEAERIGDIDTMMNLGTSNFNDEITYFAQNMRGLQEFRNENSATAIIKKVNKNRAEAVAKKSGKAKTTTAAKKNIMHAGEIKLKKAVKIPKMKEVEDFINMLEC